MRQVLMQNATAINAKCDSCFFTTCNKCLLQNASSFLLKNVTVYHDVQQLLQSALILLQNVIVITISDVYYKMRRYVKTVFSFFMFLQMVFVNSEKDHLAPV